MGDYNIRVIYHNIWYIPINKNQLKSPCYFVLGYCYSLLVIVSDYWLLALATYYLIPYNQLMICAHRLKGGMNRHFSYHNPL